MKIFREGVIAVALSLCGGHAFADYEYVPTDEAANKLSIGDAESIVRKFLMANYGTQTSGGLCVGSGRGPRQYAPVSSVRFLPDRIELDATGYRNPTPGETGCNLGWISPRSIYFVAPIRLTYTSRFGSSDSLQIPGYIYTSIVNHDPYVGDDARQVADGLRRLQIEYQRVKRIADATEAQQKLQRDQEKVKRDQEMQAQFDAAVRRYRESSPKPTLSEEARKYSVQAEFLIGQKQFEQAAALLEKALQIDPWWPAGHFNLALILAELKKYNEAIFEMRRYLALEPIAQDARAAQDKIYQWEVVATASVAQSLDEFVRGMTGRWAIDCGDPKRGAYTYRKQDNMLLGGFESPSSRTTAPIDMNTVKYLGLKEGMRRYSYQYTQTFNDGRSGRYDVVMDIDAATRRFIENIRDGEPLVRDGRIVSSGSPTLPIRKCAN